MGSAWKDWFSSVGFHLLLGVVLLSVSVLGMQHNQSAVRNKAVDRLLDTVEEGVRRSIAEKRTQLPDVKTGWPIGRGWLRVNLSLDCSCGNISGFEGISRTSYVSAAKRGSELRIWMSLRIRRIEISYSTCTGKFGKIRSSGPLQIVAKGLTFDIHLILKKSGKKCRIEVEKIRVTDIEEMKFQMGGGMKKRFKKMIADYVAKKKHDEVINTMNQNLQPSSINSLIQNLNFCDKLFHDIT